MAKVKTNVVVEDGGEFIVVPEMRNGMVCWREVAIAN